MLVYTILETGMLTVWLQKLLFGNYLGKMKQLLAHPLKLL